MLSKKEIKEAIVDRLEHITESSNSFNINRNEGIIIGLLWALTGKHNFSLSKTFSEVFDLVGISYTRKDNSIHWEIKDV